MILSCLYSTSLIENVFTCIISTGGYGNSEKSGRNYYAFYLKIRKLKVVNPEMPSQPAETQGETS